MPADRMTLRRRRIQFARYILRRPYIRVMGAPLQGYFWTTNRSYEYLLGTHESPAVLGRFLSWLAEDSVFFDIGANVGYFSFVASTVIRTGRIHAFEPMPGNQAIFRGHLARNAARPGVSRIELLPLAVSDADRTVSFTNDVALSGSNTYIQSDFLGEKTNRITVDCVSIDRHILRGAPVPDVIKIDVEGAELDVLRGAENTLRKSRPRLLLATHDVHVAGITEACIDYLAALDYVVVNTGHVSPRMSGLEDFLAVPRELELPDELMNPAWRFVAVGATELPLLEAGPISGQIGGRIGVEVSQQLTG